MFFSKLKVTFICDGNQIENAITASRLIHLIPVLLFTGNLLRFPRENIVQKFFRQLLGGKYFNKIASPVFTYYDNLSLGT